MKRLTTNCPDNNLDAALNLFYIKDFETWVRGGGDGPDYPDIRLYDFIRKAAKILLPDLDFPMDDDVVDYAMGELLLDGPDEPTGLLALLYTAAWSYAELRGRLMQYEDTGLTPAEFAAYWTFIQDLIGNPKSINPLPESEKTPKTDLSNRTVFRAPDDAQKRKASAKRTLPMSAGEIVRSYKQAAKPEEQISILAELNACSVDEIREILLQLGVELPKAKKRQPGRPKKGSV